MPVWLDFVLFVAAWVYPFGPSVIRRTVVSDSVAVAICALGLFVAIWSRKVLGAEWSRDDELMQGRKLVEHGPYRFMRHPIYTGHLLMGLGTTICLGLDCCVCGASVVRVGVLDKTEPGGMPPSAGLPYEYPAYKARVKALIPYVL
jgi:protein-S-isoprenylcysteine O-methyltransferase Ste14